MTKYELSETWIKASIAGTIWAASEIVLGSFLHNLRVPFSGNILTGLGIVILVAISHSWKEKGLFWRAGIICAIMKTISPSAVIFGPIIAILSEAFLLEISVRLLGKTFPGFVVGSMLAMSWNLFQRVANLLLFYGMNVIDLYADLIKMAQKQLQIQSDILWLPLIVLLVVYCVMGIISAVIGIRIGRKLLLQPKNSAFSPFAVVAAAKSIRSPHDFRYSIVWLMVDLVMLVSALAILNYAGTVYWLTVITIFSIVWAFRYKRALRQLSKPRFWLLFVGITMITAFVFSKVQGQSWQEGMLIGLQMNFRAVVVVLGFSVLGTELYNPVIRSFFLKTSFKQFPAALELSFESLPQMIANIPDLKTVVNNPVSVIYQVILLGEERLQVIKSMQNALPKVYLVSGILAAGKTSFARIVAEFVQKQKFEVGGFLSERLVENGETIGYDLLDLITNERINFLRLCDDTVKNQIGRFSIHEEGLEKGVQSIENAINNRTRLVVIDEVGKLELRGEGWATALQKLLALSQSIILITVRSGMEQEVIEKWHITDYQILHVGVTDPVYLAERIARKLGDKNN
jgi:nucleoside-triphosphatase THEP1